MRYSMDTALPSNVAKIKTCTKMLLETMTNVNICNM